MPKTRTYECRTEACPNKGHKVTVKPETVGVPGLLISWPQVRCANCEAEPVRTDLLDEEENTDGA